MTSPIPSSLFKLISRLVKPVSPFAYYCHSDSQNCKDYLSGYLPISSGTIIVSGRVSNIRPFPTNLISFKRLPLGYLPISFGTILVSGRVSYIRPFPTNLMPFKIQPQLWIGKMFFLGCFV